MESLKKKPVSHVKKNTQNRNLRYFFEMAIARLPLKTIYEYC